MSELEQRRPAVIEGQMVEHCAARVEQVRVPHAGRQRLGAELRAMAERGEIASAFDLHQDPKTREWVVSIVRIREPRDRTPWHVAGAAAALGAVVTVGAMLYHARWVIFGTVCSLAALSLIIAFVLSRGGHSGACVGLHCSGCRG